MKLLADELWLFFNQMMEGCKPHHQVFRHTIKIGKPDKLEPHERIRAAAREISDELEEAFMMQMKLMGFSN